MQEFRSLASTGYYYHHPDYRSPTQIGLFVIGHKIIVRLIDLCADLGGKVLVHGSPKQRQVSESDDPLKARYRARDLLATVSEYAAEAGVIYVLEPLAPLETNFINTVDDAVQLITSIGNSVLRTMIDTCAAGIGEAIHTATYRSMASNRYCCTCAKARLHSHQFWLPFSETVTLESQLSNPSNISQTGPLQRLRPLAT